MDEKDISNMNDAEHIRVKALNEISESALRAIMAPMERGANFIDVITILENVTVGIIAILVKPEGQQTLLDGFCGRVKERLRDYNAAKGQENAKNGTVTGPTASKGS